MPVPLLVAGAVLIILLAVVAVIYLSKSGKHVHLEKNGFAMVTLVLSLICLVISARLFWNMGVYADEYGSSPDLICGGWFWLYMDWIRLGLLLVLCAGSGLKLIKLSE